MQRRRSLLGLAGLFLACQTFALQTWSSPPPPPKSKQVFIPSNVTESKLVREVPPKFPSLVQEMRATPVVLLATIDEKGKVIKVDTHSGYAICNDAAKRAVKQWAYTPTLIGGAEPVEVIATIRPELCTLSGNEDMIS